MDTDFKLLLTFRDELQARMFLGKLESEGILAKFGSTSVGPTRFSAPNEFGIYVKNQDFEKAKKIADGLNFISAGKNKQALLMYPLVAIIIIFLVAFLLSKLIK